MSQPLNVTITESEARQRNQDIRRRVEVPEYGIAQLSGQMLKSTIQPKPHIRECGEERRSGRKMVQDEFAQIERKVALICL